MNARLPRPSAATLALLALATLGSASLHAQTTLLNDTFSDNERATQSLPSSAAWYFGSSGTGATGNASSGAYVLSRGTSASTAATTVYFTSAGTPISLAVGDSISVSFNFSYSAAFNQANAIRFGLFNSGGSRLTADSTANNGADLAYDAWTGYSVWANSGTSTATGLGLYERSGAVSGAAETPIGASPINTSLTTATSALTANNTTYSANLTIARTALGLDITGTVAGNSVNFSDTTPTATSFDALHIWFASQILSPSATIDNVLVTSSIPEPSAFAALAGLGALGFVALRRRPRA